MKYLKNTILFSLMIIYEEILFSYFIFNDISNIFYKIIFSVIFAIILSLIINSVPKKVSNVLKNITVFIIAFIFSAQFVYYQIYKSIISFYSFSNGGQVLQFWQTILNVIKNNFNKIALLLYPIVVRIGAIRAGKLIKGKFVIRIVNAKEKLEELEKLVETEKNKDKINTANNTKTSNDNNEPILSLTIIRKPKKISKFKLKFMKITSKLKPKVKAILIIVVLHIVALSAMSLEDISEENSEIYSTINLYTKSHVPTLMADKFGVLTTMRLDLQRLITNYTDNTILTISNNFKEIETEKIPEYNMIDINWNNLIENESNATIKQMHEYFSVQQPTQKNEYTGMFKGKNVVVFVAEAFNEVAIDEKLTPTLYKLYSQGFQFDNFYTPLFPVSTADGEYITDTSLIPKENVWSISKVSNNYMPYSYANVFEKLGYTSHAYHDHSATYYDRDNYLKGMGYDSYLARGTGLEQRMDCSHWPNSDLDMINATVDDYINDPHFLAYYMTVSGHLEYNTGGNYIANKNWDLVKDLPYSNKAKCYMATQMELDKAIEALIRKLEEKGRLEDTVIIISGDHYPYGLSLDELNELSDYQKDDNFEKHRMPFLIWNSGMSNPIKVDKVGCSLDVLPTVLNLFGIEFDSRLLMGTDLLSNSEGLVIFSNRSFITEKGRYNSLTKTFQKNENTKESDEFNTEEYVDNISKIIFNKYQMSRLILENDYYKVLFKKSEN